MTKIEANTQGLAMFDDTQGVLVGLSITLSLQLSHPVPAAVPVGKAVQTPQTNSSSERARTRSKATHRDRQMAV